MPRASRGRRILLAAWVAANAAVLAVLVYDPQMTRKAPGCDSGGAWVDSIAPEPRDLCGVVTSSLVEREDLVIGALVENVFALGAWYVTRPRFGLVRSAHAAPFER